MTGEQTHDLLHYLIECAFAAYLVWRAKTGRQRYARVAQQVVDTESPHTVDKAVARAVHAVQSKAVR